MPHISTHVDLCNGHDACTPRDFAEHSSSVLVEGFYVTREGDALKEHGCGEHAPHSAKVTQGYPSVTANGKRVAYVGAAVDCPSHVIDTGRPSVRLGEGSSIRWPGSPTPSQTEGQ
jgi:uncharacterized Zn-binding protein involved in type VI secretion